MPDEKPRMHPYALPRQAACPSSWAESQGKPNISDAAANLGRAYHRCMKDAALGSRESVQLAEIARLYAVDLKELERLFDAMTFQPEGCPEFPITVERFGMIWSGRVDLLQNHATHFEITDWKTTRLIEEDSEPADDPQCMAYAVMLRHEMQKDAELRKPVHCRKAYPRQGDAGWSEPLIVDDSNEELIWAKLRAIAEKSLQQARLPQSKRTYQTGPHCHYCPGRPGCPAHTKDLKMMMAVDDPKVQEVQITLSNAYQLAQAVRTWRGILTRVNDQLKEFCQDTPAPGPNGDVLMLETKEIAPAKSEKNLREAAQKLGYEQQLAEILTEIAQLPPQRRRELVTKKV